MRLAVKKDPTLTLRDGGVEGFEGWRDSLQGFQEWSMPESTHFDEFNQINVKFELKIFRIDNFSQRKRTENSD